MWRSDGTKLSGRYGTWEGQEFELRNPKPIRGVMYLVQEGGDRPGPDWTAVDQTHQFSRPPVAYILPVPPEEVSNIHTVRTFGELGPGQLVEILAEGAGGDLSVVSIEVPVIYKKMLVSDHGFGTYSDEPVERSSVFGWLPAEKIHNIRSKIVWRKDDAS